MIDFKLEELGSSVPQSVTGTLRKDILDNEYSGAVYDDPQTGQSEYLIAGLTVKQLYDLGYDSIKDLPQLHSMHVQGGITLVHFDGVEDVIGFVFSQKMELVLQHNFGKLLSVDWGIYRIEEPSSSVPGTGGLQPVVYDGVPVKMPFVELRSFFVSVHDKGLSEALLEYRNQYGNMIESESDDVIDLGVGRELSETEKLLKPVNNLQDNLSEIKNAFEIGVDETIAPIDTESLVEAEEESIADPESFDVDEDVVETYADDEMGGSDELVEDHADYLSDDLIDSAPEDTSLDVSDHSIIVDDSPLLTENKIDKEPVMENIQNNPLFSKPSESAVPDVPVTANSVPVRLIPIDEIIASVRPVPESPFEETYFNDTADLAKKLEMISISDQILQSLPVDAQQRLTDAVNKERRLLASQYFDDLRLILEDTASELDYKNPESASPDILELYSTKVEKLEKETNELMKKTYAQEKEQAERDFERGYDAWWEKVRADPKGFYNSQYKEMKLLKPLEEKHHQLKTECDQKIQKIKENFDELLMENILPAKISRDLQQLVRSVQKMTTATNQTLMMHVSSEQMSQNMAQMIQSLKQTLSSEMDEVKRQTSAEVQTVETNIQAALDSRLSQMSQPVVEQTSFTESVSSDPVTDSFSEPMVDYSVPQAEDVSDPYADILNGPSDIPADEMVNDFNSGYDSVLNQAVDPTPTMTFESSPSDFNAVSEDMSTAFGTDYAAANDPIPGDVGGGLFDQIPSDVNGGGLFNDAAAGSNLFNDVPADVANPVNPSASSLFSETEGAGSSSLFEATDNHTAVSNDEPEDKPKKKLFGFGKKKK